MRIKLGDVCSEFIVPQRNKPTIFDGNIPWCRIEDITHKYLEKSSSNHCVSKETVKKMNLRIYPINTVLFSCSATIGTVAIVKKPLITNQTFIGLVCDDSKISYEWLYYYLMINKHNIANCGIGSTIKYISREQFENFEIDLPDRKTQNKIAEILSGIDEQINRNNKVVKKLQVLAQTTYSRWFNQFEFPNEDGLPYKSSGGRMVLNDELKRKIPEGWIVKSLGDLLLKNTEKLKNYNDVPTIDLSVMQSDNFALGELNTSNNFSTNLFVMHKGDLMFGSIRPYLHKAGIATCDGAFAGTVHSYKTIDNTDYNVCLSALISNDIFTFAVKNAKGTKMPVISSDDLLRYKIPYNNSVSRQFTGLLDIKNIVCNCMMQNNILTELKNSILPLLINGQLKV